MAGLEEQAQWENDVYQIETTDPVVGGPPDLAQKQGITNIPHQHLANRTAWLKAQVDALNTLLAGGVEQYVTDGELATAIAEFVTQAAIDAAVNNLVDGAPAALNTLKELADELGDNDDAIAALTALIAGKLNTSAYTAADILAKLKTVDGNGSGLDADLLDGLSSSTFARSTRTISAGTGLTGGGSLASNRTISASVPTQAEAEAGTIHSKLMTPLRTKQAITKAINSLIDGAPAALNTLKELADELADNDNAIAALTTQIGTKLNASNYTAADILAKLKTVDGAGSGLDADKLDGVSSGSFVRTTRTISAGTGLTGGGALSANRTINVNFAEQNDAEGGANTTEVMNALRTHQAIKAVQSNALPTAWVNFNGQGTVAIREAHNVASVTDLGAGRYRVNFASPMANTNYGIFGLHGMASSASDERNNLYIDGKTTTYAQFYTTNVHGQAGDWDNVSILIMGGK